MDSLTTAFTKATSKKLDLLKDSLKLDALKHSFNVMFADTRHGMDAKTRESFDHIKARAAGDAHVAKYVAKIELSISNHMPHVVMHALHKM